MWEGNMLTSNAFHGFISSLHRIKEEFDTEYYIDVIIGLLFLKYIFDGFEERYQELVQQGKGFEKDELSFKSVNVLYVPEIAHWSNIKIDSKNPMIGIKIDHAIKVIENRYIYLTGGLIKNYSKQKGSETGLGKIIDLLSFDIGTREARSNNTFITLCESVISEFNIFRNGNNYVPPSILKLLDNRIDSTELRTYKMIFLAFYLNVKGKHPDSTSSNSKHDGKDGHWLERRFGKLPDSQIKADILGFELKNETKIKTTFGDWSANRYIYKTSEYVEYFKGNDNFERQNSFCEIFGSPNALKEGRFSWSGNPCPKIQGYNDYGQVLEVQENNDIVAKYSYSKDKRVNKSEIIPIGLQKDNIELARWFGEISPTSAKADKCLKEKLEDKFNDKGWFTCKKGIDGTYQKICFGEPMIYENWINFVRLGIIFFDSGMYQGNRRPYSQWRASNSYWDSLIVDRYK